MEPAKGNMLQWTKPVNRCFVNPNHPHTKQTLRREINRNGTQRKIGNPREGEAILGFTPHHNNTFGTLNGRPSFEKNFISPSLLHLNVLFASVPKCLGVFYCERNLKPSNIVHGHGAWSSHSLSPSRFPSPLLYEKSCSSQYVWINIDDHACCIILSLFAPLCSSVSPSHPLEKKSISLYLYVQLIAELQGEEEDSLHSLPSP